MAAQPAICSEADRVPSAWYGQIERRRRLALEDSGGGAGAGGARIQHKERCVTDAAAERLRSSATLLAEMRMCSLQAAQQ